MTDRNRNQDQQNRDQQQRAPGATREDLDQSPERDRSTRDRQSVADDRPFRSGREDVDLGADIETEPGIDEGDEEIGGPGRSDR